LGQYSVLAILTPVYVVFLTRSEKEVFLGVILGSFWGHFGVVFSFGHLYPCLCRVFDQVWKRGVFGGHFGVILGSFWGSIQFWPFTPLFMSCF
jgi:hypothetical protein